MPRPRSAFTLIELLVSIAIGMGLLALGTSALLHVSKVFNRNTVQMQARDDARTIHQRLESGFTSMYHAAQLRCRVDPGEPASDPPVWNNGNEVIELTWMSCLGDIDEPTMDTLPGHVSDMVWNRLRWTGRGVNKEGGYLEFAMSSPSVVSSSITSPAASTSTGNVLTGPQPRRDRRRDMDDNDLRFLPGISAAKYGELQLVGNGADLDQRLRRMHPIYTQVQNVAVEWVDQDGFTVRGDAQAGITVRNAAGVVQPPLGLPYANGQVMVIDGAWLDGRPAPSAGTARLASAQRPLLIRISFELIPAGQEDPEDLSRDPHLPFSFTFRVAPMLPRL